MFIDKVKLEVIAGKGGDGLVSFRREKYVPLGGPYGGDGGKGGDIIVAVDTNRSTLLDLNYQKKIKSENGENGKNKKMHGSYGRDTILYVPLGTMFKDANTGEMLVDLVDINQQAILAHGGKGGQGNTRFKTSRNPAPDFAEKGALGEHREVIVELKLLADVGLIGFPSVGKSTLLSVISAAKPEIAAYPFTTITPNLGVVSVKDMPSFVVADMPGLIEGASQGKGLGIEFLRHIERTKVLVHVLDMGAVDHRDPIEDYKMINDELKNYVVDLSNRPQIVVANKMDLDESKENLKRFKQELPDVEVFDISAPIHQGLDKLLYKIGATLQDVKEKESIVTPEPTFTYTYQPEKPKFEVTKISEQKFRLTGDALINKYRQFNLDSEESSRRFAYIMKRWGVDDALRQAGAVDGDIVAIDEITFIFDESEQLD